MEILMMTDICFIAVPKRWHSVNFEHACTLPHALGKLKAIVEQKNYKARTLDFAIQYVRKSFVHQDIFKELEEYFSQSMMRPWGDENPLTEKTEQFWNSLLSDWVRQIKTINPKFVGISIVLNESITPAFQLCRKIREELPHIKIIIGGGALEDYMDTENKLTVADIFHDMNKCDYYVVGPGEDVILKILNNQTNIPGVNNRNPLWNISFEHPIADYSDLNLKDYILPTPWDLSTPLTPRAIVTFSRGCPQKCRFCSDRNMPEKFSARDIDDTYNEIIHYYEKYKITKFFMSDLSFNINPKKTKTLLEKIKLYQHQHGVKFDFISLNVIHPKEKFPEDMWKLLSDTGFYSIGFGVESASKKIRQDMQKGSFENTDIQFTIDMCIKYNIQPMILMMVGYPTETEDDFKQTIKLFVDNMPQVNTNTETNSMFAVSVFRLEEKSELGMYPEKYSIEIIKQKKNEAFEHMWKSQTNDSKIANQRGIRVEYIFKYLGYKCNVEGVDYSQINNDELTQLIKNDQKYINELLKRRTPMTLCKLNMDKIQNHKDKLYNHELFTLNYIQSIDDIKTIMGLHVFAVWDFMSLVKKLQVELSTVRSSTQSFWKPNRKVSPILTRFINSIVLDEESDITPVKDEYMSHFDLYLTAMKEIGADIAPVLQFINNIETNGMGFALDRLIEKDLSPAVDFMRSTIEFTGLEPHITASAFAFGRETIIPDMFKRILQQLNINKLDAPYFHFYLERHIHVDGEEHGNYSVQMVEELCRNDPLKILEAEDAAIKAIDARIKLWDAVVKRLA